MEIQYKRETKRNYLIIEPGQTENTGYEAKMLMRNRIPGLLNFHVKFIDDSQIYYYDITSLQPLIRLAEGRWISREEVCRLLIQIDGVLNRAREYLLDGDHLLLDPEYIYMDLEWNQIAFCFVPGLKGNFPEALSRLLQYILKKTDHRDKEGVVLAYGLYQESLKENYGLDNLLQLIHKDEKKGEESLYERKKAVQEGEIKEQESPFAGHPTVGYLDSSCSQEGKKAEPFMEKAAERAVCLKRIILFNLGVLPLSMGLMWLLGGWRGLKTWGIPAAAICSLGGTGVLCLMLFLGRRGWKEKEIQEKHEICLGEPETPEDRQRGRAKEEEPLNTLDEEKWMQAQEQPLSYFKTVPLAAAEEKQEEIHCLEPEDFQRKKIELRYFPFIIGKQEDLVDFCLTDDTVSRLHLRLDREENCCWATDLNSTNGTSVNGKMLDANESVPLQEGDEVVIAGIRYHFR